MSNNNLTQFINKCQNAGGETMWECVKRAKDRIERENPESNKVVYPWINYDWDYTTYIDNNYNSDVTGTTPSGSWPALFNNPKAMFQLAKGFIIDPNPSGGSSAGNDDQMDCNAVPEHNRASCNVIREIRQSYKTQPKPKNTPFFNAKLDGKSSSSYYYKTGYCTSEKINNEKDCTNSQGTWLSNKCYKPRYALIKNEPGVDFRKLGDNALTKLANTFAGPLEGNAPSVIGDLFSFSPNNIIDIINLKNTRDYILEPCVEYMTGNYKEHFNTDESKIYYKTLGMFILFCFIIMIFITLIHRIIK